jgi:hypothetical protein
MSDHSSLFSDLFPEENVPESDLGRTLTQLRALAKMSDFRGIPIALAALRTRDPQAANIARTRVHKIVGSELCKPNGIGSKLLAMDKERPSWGEELERSADDPESFARVVESLKGDLARLARKPADP